MFIEDKTPIRAFTRDGKFYTGTVFKIVIESRENPTYNPDAVLFIAQNYDYVEQEGEFKCIFLHLADIESIEILDKEKTG